MSTTTTQAYILQNSSHQNTKKEIKIINDHTFTTVFKSYQDALVQTHHPMAFQCLLQYLLVKHAHEFHDEAKKKNTVQSRHNKAYIIGQRQKQHDSGHCTKPSLCSLVAFIK